MELTQPYLLAIKSKKFFQKNFKILYENLVDKIVNFKKLKNKILFTNEITGEESKSKINKIVNYLNDKDIDYIFISAPENVAWLLIYEEMTRQQIQYPIPPNHKRNKKIIIAKKKLKFLIKKKYFKSVRL